jgi:hypothetical protein
MLSGFGGKRHMKTRLNLGQKTGTHRFFMAERLIRGAYNYSDDDYIRMGNLTNTQYIVTGKIAKIAGNYSVSFRINHAETNEIKTAFDKTYPLKDIETGLASKEAACELLAGMGIQLTEAGEKITGAIITRN